MWYSTVLDFKNLLTHTDSKVKFVRGETILVIGKNKANKQGLNSNGSGKSAIVNAYCLSITGDTERGVDKEDFIRFGETDCTVKHILRNDVLKRIMIIKRKFFLKGSQELSLIIKDYNKNVLEELDSSRDKNAAFIQSKIYKEIGICKEDLLEYYIINQDNAKSFLSATDTKQKEVIARFSNFNMIDPLIEKHSKIVREANIRIDSLKSQNENDELIIEEYKELIEKDKREFKQKKQEQINSIKDSNENFEIDNVRLLKSLKIYQKELSDIGEEIQKQELEQEKITTLKSERKEWKEKIIRKEGRIEEIEEDISIWNKKKLGLVKCPKCKHKFHPTQTEYTVEDIETNIEDNESLLEEEKSLLLSLKNSLKIVNDKIEKLSHIEAKISELENQAKLKRKGLQDVRNCIEANNEEIEEGEGLIGELLKQKEPDLSERIGLISKRQESIDSRLEQIRECELEIENSKFLSYHFSNKGFKTFLANKTIKSIQDMINFYLQKFNMDCQILINGVTVLKNGDVRDKMTIKVLNENRVQNFKAYSGGEKIRITVCCIIALNTLINSICEEGRGLDCLIIDEIPFIDFSGSKKMLETFEESEKTSMLIMHHIENVYCKNKLFVVKEKRESKIYTDDTV